jgi:hypothetical protein
MNLRDFADPRELMSRAVALDRVRRSIPSGLHRRPRQPNDALTIMEAWAVLLNEGKGRLIRVSY